MWTVISSFAVMKKSLLSHKRKIFDYRRSIVMDFISKSCTKGASMCFALKRKENMNFCISRLNIL